MLTKPPRDPADKAKDLPLEKTATAGREGTEDGVVMVAAGTPGGATAPPSTTTTTASTSKPGSPAALSPSPSTTDQKRTVMDVTSQGVQTTSPFSGPMHEDKEEKKEAVQEWVEGKSVKSEDLSTIGPFFYFSIFLFCPEWICYMFWSYSSFLVMLNYDLLFNESGLFMLAITKRLTVHCSFKHERFHRLPAGRWGNQLSTQMRMSLNPGSTHRSVPLLLHT